MQSLLHAAPFLLITWREKKETRLTMTCDSNKGKIYKEIFTWFVWICVIIEFPCVRKKTQCHCTVKEFVWIKSLHWWLKSFHASYQRHVDYCLGGTITVEVWHVEVGPMSRSFGWDSLGVGALGSQFALWVGGGVGGFINLFWVGTSWNVGHSVRGGWDKLCVQIDINLLNSY
jgi:hypothetical protein